MTHYKQCIQIKNNVTDIMKLPCIFSCHKMNDHEFEYLLYDWNNYGEYTKAHIGDWLCQDNQGKWHKLTNEEYGKL